MLSAQQNQCFPPGQHPAGQSVPPGQHLSSSSFIWRICLWVFSSLGTLSRNLSQFTLRSCCWISSVGNPKQSSGLPGQQSSGESTAHCQLFSQQTLAHLLYFFVFRVVQYGNKIINQIGRQTIKVPKALRATAGRTCGPPCVALSIGESQEAKECEKCFHLEWSGASSTKTGSTNKDKGLFFALLFNEIC